MMNSCGKRPVDAQNVSWSLKKQRKKKELTKLGIAVSTMLQN